MLRSQCSIWTRNRFYESLDEKQVNKKESERTNRLWNSKSLQFTAKYRNQDWLYSSAITTVFSLGSESELEKLKHEQVISLLQGVYTSGFKAFDFVDIFSDKRQLFQVSIIHDSDDRPRTSKSSRKSAQFVRTSIQNESTIFEQSWRSNARATVSISCS